LALPILVVAASVLEPASDVWRHIVDTLLARYLGNTALLVALVACGVISIGVLSAWLVATYRFPGVRLLEWALVLPLAMPAYVMA
jgi:iron(III) transport system permease protein